ncbi:2OG-Fe(II) oxygenase [Pedobacter sp. R20-19]|uniref:prolyl hydroxylase family protein n=1 Tax=Pedobacter sp. R20-19 TaxID=1270196 RepID=UPI00068A986F|nr:2OG-Fe(II) oxygenase [Pedobacter sp. R20-19]
MLLNTETTHIPSDIIFNDTYVAINNLLALYGHHIPRYVIRNYMIEVAGFPNISLYSMVELLVRCNGIPKVKEIQTQEIFSQTLPAIGHISCNGKNGVYITLLHVHDLNITYLGPDNLVKTESITELKKRWTGFIITCKFESNGLNEDEFSVTPGYESAKKYITTLNLTDHFLSTEECDEVIRISEEQSGYERSLVELLNKDDSTEKSALRTSFSTVLKNDHKQSIIQFIYEKAAEFAQVSIHQMEAIQCVRYASGQEYKTHFDGDQFNKRGKTILVYLNDDFIGGETSFTEIDVKIKPKKGTALLFYNLDDNQNPLIESAHCGMPVISGVKYAMNIWIKNKPLH